MTQVKYYYNVLKSASLINLTKGPPDVVYSTACHIPPLEVEPLLELFAAIGRGRGGASLACDEGLAGGTCGRGPQPYLRSTARATSR